MTPASDLASWMMCMRVFFPMPTTAQLESRNLPSLLPVWLWQDDKTSPDKLDPALWLHLIHLRLFTLE